MKKITLSLFCFIICLKAFMQTPAPCYKPTPEWDKVNSLKEKIQNSKSLPQDKKNELLDRYNIFKEVEDSYYNGTSEWCKEFDEFQIQNQLYIKDVADQNAEAKLQNDDAANFNSQCGGQLTESEYKSCLEWKGRVDDWAQRINSWKEKLDKWYRSLTDESQNLNEKGDQINAELLNSYNEFIIDAEEALTTLSPEAARIVNALNNAAKAINLDPNNPDPDDELNQLNCKKYFHAFGSEMGAVGSEWTDNTLSANEISEILANKSGSWHKINESEVQDYANKGTVCIGVSKDNPHGHIAIASPVPSTFDMNRLKGHGPMVRDGNVHNGDNNVFDQDFPSGYGTIRASIAFRKDNPATWYIWIH